MNSVCNEIAAANLSHGFTGGLWLLKVSSLQTPQDFFPEFPKAFQA